MFFQCLKTVIWFNKVTHPLQTNEVLTYVLIIYFSFILLINISENIKQHSSETTPGNLIVKHSSTPLYHTHWIMKKRNTHASNSDTLLHLISSLFCLHIYTPPYSYSWHTSFFLCMVFQFSLESIFKLWVLLVLRILSSPPYILTAYQSVNFSRTGTLFHLFSLCFSVLVWEISLVIN